MQWNLIMNSNNLPEPGEKVLGLWPGGVWEPIMYSRDAGWYTPVDGALRGEPIGWARVATTCPTVIGASEVGPVCEEGPLGPDAS